MDNIEFLNEKLEGFSKLNRKERLTRLKELGIITENDIAFLNAPSAMEPELAEKFIENVMGYFQLPLGVAMNFRINGNDYAIPMAVEETSIIAAASKTAKWIRQEGEIKTNTLSQDSIGQIQFSKVANFSEFASKIEENKKNLIELANNSVASGLLARGGGVSDLLIRSIERPDGKTMAIIHLHVATCDAMGANIINQICEFMKEPLENITQEKASICILSNLNDRKITRAEVIIRNIDPILGEKIQEASLFAELDPYRAATHNKGILNAIDAILVATGNDWRAVEAGIHAYAARSGQYRAVSSWKMNGKDLIGTIEVPISVGTVGGVTKLHPTAQMCMRILRVKHAEELAEIAAAVGLIQNLGAICALTTIGIIEGHMKLHISNLTLSAGASANEAPLVESRLKEILKKEKRISLRHAETILETLRAGVPA